ncbi:MAG: hypothetical protein N2234_07010 [Planctomycetota bacterium]|nr:hypothetical protein [Planctomycetota bacterium]
MRLFLLLCLLLFVCGCMIGEPISEPPKPPYFKPKKYADERLSINPWRDTPPGPSYPFVIFCDEEEEVYRVVRRHGAPDIYTPPKEPQTPPATYRRPLIYEEEMRRK